MTLWLPDQPDETPLMVCRVLVDTDTMCGMVFRDRHAWESHVNHCAREHIDVIRAHSLENRMPIFKSWDPEVEEHMLKVGRRMREEGRWEVKPSERAGFS